MYRIKIYEKKKNADDIKKEKDKKKFPQILRNFLSSISLTLPFLLSLSLSSFLAVKLQIADVPNINEKKYIKEFYLIFNRIWLAQKNL